MRFGTLLGGLMVSMGLSSVSMAGAVKTYTNGMTNFVENAAGTAIYATVPSQNSIAIIDPNTLTSTLVGIGSNPTGLALSPDGSTLYVANSGSNFLGIYNTQTHTVGTPMALGAGVTPTDVQIGTNNRLWVVTTNNAIIQIDATTGASTGNSIGSYKALIKTTPDGKTLYYTDTGLGPSTQVKFDVSGANASSLWSTGSQFDGSGIDISRDGALVSFAYNGGPTGVLQASSKLQLGALGSASTVAFAPDNSEAFTGVFFNKGIAVTSLTTYLQVGTISTTGGPGNLWVDRSGRYLFSNEGSEQVYATGVPEPTALAFVGIGATALLARRRRD